MSLESLIVGLVDELADKGIWTGCISPSDTFTKTYRKFFPKFAVRGQILEPAEIARFAALLCNQDTFKSGQIIEMQKNTNT